MIKKSGQNFKHGKKNEKSFYYEIKKHFSSFSKEFQLPEIVSNPRVGL